MLMESSRRFLEAKYGLGRTRQISEHGDAFDRQLWQDIAGQGWQAMMIPEALGGAGFGLVEACLLAEELGRTLSPIPFWSSAVAATAALLSADSGELKEAWLPRLAAGEAVATLAVAEPGGDWGPGGTETGAEPARAGTKLTGLKAYVTDGHVADLLLVTARAEGEVCLYAVAANAPGVEIEIMPTLDLTRRQASVRLSSAPGDLVGDWAVAAAGLAAARSALAAEQVGGARRVLEMAVEYAKERKQFGRAIGSFQAVKHACADMLVEVEAARSTAMQAARALANAHPEAEAAVLAAKAFCSEVYFRAAASNIQIHGGIGFTWEHDAHLFFKRAKSSELLLGGSEWHRRALALELQL
jgi:alkylation response protein AidB-like acyl-CoA dehydrogenase